MQVLRNRRFYSSLLIALCLWACILVLCGAPLAADLEVKIFKLNYRTPDDVIPLLRLFMSPEGSAVGDARTNTLIVKDHPANLAKIEEFLKGQDIPLPTVSITAQFTNAAVTRRSGAGVDLRVGGGIWTATMYTPSSQSAGRADSVNIMVMSGSMASISVGESSPYTEWFLGYSRRFGYIAENVVFQRVATSLAVIPGVRGDDIIHLKVVPQISWFSGSGSGVIRFREAATEFEMRSGDSVMLASTASHDSVVNHVLGSYTDSVTESTGIILTAKVMKSFY